MSVERPVLHHVTLKTTRKDEMIAWYVDPIGTVCDPGAVLEADRDGMNHEELHRAAYAGEFPPTMAPDQRLPT